MIDETPLKILREVQALVKYYYAPQMNCVAFENKLDRLSYMVEKEIAAREAEIKVPVVPKVEYVEPKQDALF